MGYRRSSIISKSGSGAGATRCSRLLVEYEPLVERDPGLEDRKEPVFGDGPNVDLVEFVDLQVLVEVDSNAILDGVQAFRVASREIGGGDKGIRRITGLTGFGVSPQVYRRSFGSEMALGLFCERDDWEIH